MFCLFVWATQLPLETPTQLIGVFPVETALPSTSALDFNGRYLKTSFLYQEGDGAPVSSTFLVRSYGNTCFASVEADDDFWRGRLVHSNFAEPQGLVHNAFYYLQDVSVKRIFGIGDFGFTNTPAVKVCNGSGYMYQFKEDEETWEPAREQGLEYSGDQFLAETKAEKFRLIHRLNLGREITADNYQHVCRLLNFSVMTGLAEVTIDNPYDQQLLCALARNTTLTNLREIKTDSVNEATLMAIKKMYFCLRLTRDMRQQEPRYGWDVATIRINARVDRDRLLEINQELSGKPLAISYLSNDDHDRAVLRLVV